MIGDANVQRHYRELVRARISEKFFQPYQNKGGLRSQGSARNLNLRCVCVRLCRKKRTFTAILLASMINNPALYHKVEEEFGPFIINDPAMERLRQEYCVFRQ
ncbi:MAG: hypothetical protein H6860_05405 [Rhodospirillales bacterium]|nr:hypothetical protein [Rhodospirillales bacterium]